MHFAFDEQQLEFRSQLRGWAQSHCTPADLRAAWQSAHGWSPERLKMLGELGVLGVTVPADHGGLGLGLVDLALLLEEAGRSGLPEPLLENTALSAPLLGGLGGGAGARLRERWLPALARGEAVVTVAGPGPRLLVVSGADLALVRLDGVLQAVEVSQLSVREHRRVDGARRLLEVCRRLRPERPERLRFDCGRLRRRRLRGGQVLYGGWLNGSDLWLLLGLGDRRQPEIRGLRPERPEWRRRQQFFVVRRQILKQRRFLNVSRRLFAGIKRR